MSKKRKLNSKNPKYMDKSLVTEKKVIRREWKQIVKFIHITKETLWQALSNKIFLEIASIKGTINCSKGCSLYKLNYSFNSNKYNHICSTLSDNLYRFQLSWISDSAMVFMRENILSPMVLQRLSEIV